MSLLSCENAKETYIILNFVPNFCYEVLFSVLCPKGGIFGRIEHRLVA
jgi:hypothetical protein